MRIITQNSVLPPGIVAQFTSLASVGAYFGQNSEEYARATRYFSFISKLITSPAMISFARWVNVAIPPMIVGDSVAKTIAQFTGVTAGTLTLNDGATAYPVTAINLSAATTLTQVASLLQTAIRAAATADTQLGTAVVSFNTNTNQFVIDGATSGSGAISCTATALTTDLSQLLGLATSGTVLVAGQAADLPATAVSKSAAISNNFGSFVYATPATALQPTDIANIAEWNDAQNDQYMYSFACTQSVAATIEALVIGYSGCAMNILSSTLPNDYVEQLPCEILAATNYNNVNASQNYMFYQSASRNVVVTDDTTANTLDALRANYIGATQMAGQQLAFYQRGVLMGGTDDATDMETYCNEMWLKSTIAAQIMSLFLAVGNVPADPTGQAMILGVLQPIVTQAKNNGVITAGKQLTAIQQQYITALTGDATAWRQVQTLGYWLSVTFTSGQNANSGLTEWTANYTLVYSKDDSVRQVVGSDVMI